LNTLSTSRLVASIPAISDLIALVRPQLLRHRGERAIEIVLHAQHVAREAGRRVIGRALLVLLEPAADILGLGLGVQHLLPRALDFFLKLRNALLVIAFRVEIDRVVNVLVQCLFFVHANNLDNAFAVKSTMGTTRA
jgi:hypothetical protein